MRLPTKIKPGFIEPMLLLRTEKLPEGPDWAYEILCGRPHKISYVVQPVMWRSAMQEPYSFPFRY